MKNYREIKMETVEKHLVSIVCDVCEREVKEVFEAQEFINVRFTGGYGSIFGDGDTFECDLCQHCIEKTLGKYLRKVGSLDGYYEN
jgi:NMD protein affecting ribosome stability and mRNA decay